MKSRLSGVGSPAGNGKADRLKSFLLAGMEGEEGERLCAALPGVQVGQSATNLGKI